MIRRADWEQRLDEAITARRFAPFAWGVFDCAMFAADCILAMTGEDVASPHFRGRYDSEVSAARRMNEFAGGLLYHTWEKIAAERGWPVIRPSQAGRGDIVLFQGEWGVSTGVVGLDGRKLCAPTRPGGFVRVPVGDGFRAWGVV